MTYYEKHRKIMLKEANDWNRSHRKQISRRMKIFYQKNKKQIKLEKKQQTFQNKILVLSIYSRNKLRCKKCGFDDLRALSIDHINNDGYKHRKKVGNGTWLYNWIIKNNFPPQFQVLCMNCQFIKKDDNLWKKP